MAVPSEVMDGDLSQDQIALVLRRAVELDRDAACDTGMGLDIASLELAAAEAGISVPSVRRALAELKAGVLTEPETRRRRQWLGARTLTLCRVVPGPAATVEGQLHRFLQKELFEVRRDFGERTSWIPRRGLEARVRRSVDRGVQRKLILKDVQEVGVSVVEEPASGGQRVLVRLDIDVLASRRTQGWVSGTAAVVGGGVVVLGAAATGFQPEIVLTTATGAGLVGAGRRIGSSIYANRVGELESAVGGILDRLERPASRRLP